MSNRNYASDPMERIADALERIADHHEEPDPLVCSACGTVKCLAGLFRCDDFIAMQARGEKGLYPPIHRSAWNKQHA